MALCFRRYCSLKESIKLFALFNSHCGINSFLFYLPLFFTGCIFQNNFLPQDCFELVLNFCENAHLLAFVHRISVFPSNMTIKVLRWSRYSIWKVANKQKTIHFKAWCNTAITTPSFELDRTTNRMICHPIAVQKLPASTRWSKQNLYLLFWNNLAKNSLNNYDIE